MNDSYSLLLSLPRELIYAIAAADAGVYNVILRLCRATISLFPLSTRLDFMIGFGVTVRISRVMNLAYTMWYYNDVLHDVWGAASQWLHGDRAYYWHGREHRHGAPSRVLHNCISWYQHGRPHRDLAAPAGTGVEWLCGAAEVWVLSDTAVVKWFTAGQLVRRLVSPPTSEAQAEIDYWRARE